MVYGSISRSATRHPSRLRPSVFRHQNLKPDSSKLMHSSLVKHFMDELNLLNLFNIYVLATDSIHAEYAESLCILTANIVCDNKPSIKSGNCWQNTPTAWQRKVRLWTYSTMIDLPELSLSFLFRPQYVNDKNIL